MWKTWRKRVNYNNKQNNNKWKPGDTIYKDFIERLTPEEREAHLKKRAEKKAMKKVMKQVTEEYQEQWAAELHNAAWSILMRARDKSDPIAFAAIWDRIVGKPKVDEDHLVDPERALPFKDEDLD